MKKLAVVLMVLPILAFSQGYEVTVYPHPNPSTVDSVVFLTTSDTVYSCYYVVDSLRVKNGDTLVSDSGCTPEAFVGVRMGNKLFRYSSPTIAQDTLYVVYNQGDTLLKISANVSNGDVGYVKFARPEAVFKDMIAGYPLNSTFLYNGTTVSAVVDSYKVVVSKRPTTDTSKTTVCLLVSGTYKGTQTAYATGELVGIPFTFQVPYYPEMYLDQVIVMDSSAQTAPVDIAVYDAAVISYSADNSAFAPGGASFDNLVAYIQVDTPIAVGTNTSIGIATDQQQVTHAPTGGWYYGAMIARGAPNFLGNRTLKVRLIFR